MPTTVFKSTSSAASPPIMQAAGLNNIPWLVHAFSTRAGGVSTAYNGKSLNLGFTKEDTRENVEKNRARFLVAAGAVTAGKIWPLVSLRQVHSDLVHVVRSMEPGLLAGDGLVSNVPEIALAIQTADCFPVLLVDLRNRAVGAFHAGWRGTVKRIVEKGLGIMRGEYGSRPEDMQAAIGVGIQKCCYEVGEEVRDQFASQFPYGNELVHEVFSSDAVRQKYPLLFMNARAPGHGDTGPKIHLDLQEANRRQLLAAGVPDANITAMAGCTSCNPEKFFSYRVDKGKTGRMLAIVGIRKPE